MTLLGKSDWRTRIRAERKAFYSARPREDVGRAVARSAADWLGMLDDGSAPSAAAERSRSGGQATVVCAHLAIGFEPPTEQLLETLNTLNYRVFLPVCQADYKLGWALWSPGVELLRSRFAPVMEPAGIAVPIESLDPHALLIPALAVDASGVRLGQGGGYYDRLLATVAPDTRIAAIVHDSEVFPENTLPHDPYDVRVKNVIMPGGHRVLG